MNLARHSITSTNPVLIFDARFDADCQIFTCCTSAGFAIYRTCPLRLIRKRELTGGTLSAVLPSHTSNLLFLLGGGASPKYPPNKVIVWDDKKGKEVAELEFREKVRGLACRRGWLAVALRYRVVLFEIRSGVTPGQSIKRAAEWDTCDNPGGLLAMASETNSTLLAIPGRQTGHVQLIHLPPCRPPAPTAPPPPGPPRRPPPAPTKHPAAIIIAHNHSLTNLSVPPSGHLLATASTQGTIVRVWDTHTGKMLREVRRGTDRAVIYGVAFRPDEREVCVWSDKGTVHVFALTAGSGTSNRQSTLSRINQFVTLPKYFESEWSYAQYRIPTNPYHASVSAPQSGKVPNVNVADEEKYVVGWIESPLEGDGDTDTLEHQLVALTYNGGWYRLSLPGSHPSSSALSPPTTPSAATSGSPARTGSMRHNPRSPSVSSFNSRPDKGKKKEGDTKESSHECVLREYRRFGRWDGWG